MIFGGVGMAKGKRAESRCRYLVRDIAGQKGWDVRHPQKGGDFLEEQEIEDFFPDCGFDGTKPDFIVCKKSLPLVVVEAKNDIKKIDIAISEAMEYADSINDLVLEAVRSTDHFEENKKEQLIETLKLTVGDYNRLSNKISKIVFLLKNLILNQFYKQTLIFWDYYMKRLLDMDMIIIH